MLYCNCLIVLAENIYIFAIKHLFYSYNNKINYIFAVNLSFTIMYQHSVYLSAQFNVWINIKQRDDLVIG